MHIVAVPIITAGIAHINVSRVLVHRSNVAATQWCMGINSTWFNVKIKLCWVSLFSLHTVHVYIFSPSEIQAHSPTATQRQSTLVNMCFIQGRTLVWKRNNTTESNRRIQKFNKQVPERYKCGERVGRERSENERQRGREEGRSIVKEGGRARDTVLLHVVYVFMNLFGMKTSPWNYIEYILTLTSLIHEHNKCTLKVGCWHSLYQTVHTKFSMSSAHLLTSLVYRHHHAII